MASQQWLFAAVFLALAETTWSQRTPGWRVYRAADGLRDSSCASITIGLSGKVLAAHLNPESISELDGYSVRSLPWPGAQNGGVCDSPGGQLWAITAEGLKERRDKEWFLHPVPEITGAFRSGLPPATRPVPFLPLQQGRVLFLLPERLMEFNVQEQNRPRTIELRAAAQTRLGGFTGLSPARDGGLWIAGSNGLARVAGPARVLKPDDLWQEFIPPAAMGIRNLREPQEDDDGGVTLIAETAAEENEAVHVDSQGRWTVFPFGPQRILRAWTGPNNVIRGATRESLLQWRGDRFAESEEISARQYFDVAVDSGGVFWVATSAGLFRYAPPAWRIPPSLETLDTHVRCVTADSSGRLWLVSNGKLHLWKDGARREFALPGAAQNYQTCALYPLKNGALLLAPANGLFQFNPESESFDAVRPGKQAGRVVPLGTLKDGRVCVQSVAAAANENRGLSVYDGERWEPFPLAAPDRGAGTEFTVLFATQEGAIWLGGPRSTATFHGGKWRVFASDDKDAPDGAFGFAELTGGKIWCGTPDRIWEFDGRSWSVVRGGFDRLNSLLRGSDGTIWAASEGGVYRYAKNTWIQNGAEEGLPGVVVHGICEDPQGRIWAATASGIARFFPDADTDPPRTRIQRWGDSNQAISEGGSVNILFNAEDRWKFTPRERLLFSYRLDQKDWSPFQDKNAVLFADLMSGKHSCQVRGMDRNGNIESPGSFEFTVAVPWYDETRLLLVPFYGLGVALLFAALAYGRHRQLRRNFVQVEKMVAQRTRELEQVNRELLHSQKMNALGTLAAGIAHDFNNILSIIKGSAQIIEENPGNPQKVLTRVDRIKTVVEQGSGIVKAMLGFSRDSDGPAGPCDLNGVVDDTIKLLGDRFLREVEVQFERADDLPPIPASRDFIQQILLNFLFNAAEAMSGRKQVTLSTQRLAKLPPGIVLMPVAAVVYGAVSVRDSGCGIPPENLPRIFEPFFTTKSLSARRGTGLGLSMAYELAKRMEAGLAVESAVDRGSVFTLILPVKEGGKK